MKKRVLAMGLAMAMTAGLLLSGCGNSKEGEKESGGKKGNIILTIGSAMVKRNPEDGSFKHLDVPAICGVDVALGV